MAPTKETLQAKIAALQTQQEQLMAQANACAGAVQVLRDLLRDFETPETPST